MVISRWCKPPNIRCLAAFIHKAAKPPAKTPQILQSPSTLNKIPPATVHRVTYEYPPPPKPKPEIPRESSPWKRHITYLCGLGGLIYLAYASYYFFGNSSNNEQTVLTPEKFSTYRVTHKEEINEEIVLIELSPKYLNSASLLKSRSTLWNGKKLWSIQVKHPLIQIARNYTPLPLYFLRSERYDERPLLRMMGSADDEGRMCLLVKRYEDGEMSRYLHSLSIGADVEIRGPFIEHKFPYEPADQQPLRQPMLDLPSRMPAEPQLDPSSSIIRAENIAMFTAGTGISTAIQLLLSPHNPPRGFTEVWHSARTRRDVPFNRFMLFLESAGRAKFHIFIDDENRFISVSDIPRPASSDPSETSNENKTAAVAKDLKYSSVLQQFGDKSNRVKFLPFSTAIVCGPPGYITYISGDPGHDGRNPIGGLLGAKGWTDSQVKRMIDL